MTPEHKRLEEYRLRKSNWKHWGPYVSERAWGTVREDYSANGTAWEYFPHDHARSRAYRWNEDGLAGLSDRNQYLCMGLALWNGNDPILKERLFGLTGNEGNHGEDVKEVYYYLDSSPTHSYMRMQYRYPQAAFPYARLIEENQWRGRDEDEFELIDSGVFDDDRFFDVFVTYAKAAENDIMLEIDVHNRGNEAAPIHLLPTIWFRNTWSWGYEKGPMKDVAGKPSMKALGDDWVSASHAVLGNYVWVAEGADELIFTENETNYERLFGSSSASAYTKDAFHRYIIDGDEGAVNPEKVGTKVSAVYARTIPAKSSIKIRLRLMAERSPSISAPFDDFNIALAQRRQDTDDFYATVQSENLSDEERRIQREAFAGMLWSKQLYYFDVPQWLNGDPAMPDPPEERKQGRNSDWQHLTNFDIISMPDKWEYPWYAAWDLAFHCVPLAMVDPVFAKRQLMLMTREWYMHPNGQLPAYEWAFGDVNPPTHAWATWRVYKMELDQTDQPDTEFLQRMFHKLLLNFNWWVNRKDDDENNIFQGGFLGLDNISLFDRSHMDIEDAHVDQSDGTAWMAFFCLKLLRMALELSKSDPIYEDLATKFFQHFLAIAEAMSGVQREDGHGLWDEEDGFFYDVLHLGDDEIIPLKVRSMVGLMPVFAIETMSESLLKLLPDFSRRMNWFIEHRPQFTKNMAVTGEKGEDQRLLFSILTKERLERVLQYLLDEDEFLSPYGIRSLSKYHEENPVSLEIAGKVYEIGYQPAESRTSMFGGNSNWRGPIWFPINYLLIESLEKFYTYYGDSLKVELPTGSGNWVNLLTVAQELSRRLSKLFMEGEDGNRPFNGADPTLQTNPLWRDQILFHEYFNGDDGKGLGASHQTGWTGLVAKLMNETW